MVHVVSCIICSIPYAIYNLSTFRKKSYWRPKIIKLELKPCMMCWWYRSIHCSFHSSVIHFLILWSFGILRVLYDFNNFLSHRPLVALFTFFIIMTFWLLALLMICLSEILLPCKPQPLISKQTMIWIDYWTSRKSFNVYWLRIPSNITWPELDSCV